MPGGKRCFKIAWVVLACGIGMAAAAQHRSRPVRNQRARRAHQQAPPPARDNLFTSAIRANNVGMALMNRGEFTQALGRFQTACVMNPASDTGCLNMGIALLYMGRLNDARNILAKSIQHDAHNQRAWFNLGLLERQEGNDRAAIEDLEKVAALDPNDAATQYLIGSLYLKAGKYQQAISSFRRALNLDRFNLPAEFGIAQAEGHLGDVNSALKHLNRAEHLIEAGLGGPASNDYGEQGKYSLAQEMRAPIQPAPRASPVRFVNVTRASGLPWRTASSRVRETRAKALRKSPKPSGPDALAKFLGGGACVFDYNDDGRPDIFLADGDGNEHAALYRNTGRGRFVDVTKTAKLEIRGEMLGCTTGDYDNDGHADLAVSLPDGVELFHNNADGTFTNVTDQAGVVARGLVLGMSFADYNDDGNLDLYATRFDSFPLGDSSQPFTFPANAAAPGNVLWRGSESGRFSDATKAAGLGGSWASVGALACDLNNDGAIDFVVTGWQRAPTAYLNQREGAFRATTPWASRMPGPTAGAAAFDFDHDGWMDLAFSHWSSPGLSLWRNVDGKSFERVRLPGPQWMRGWGLAAVDYDRDGWADLVAVGETFSGEGRIVLLRNLGGDGHGGLAGFRDVTHATGLDKIELHNPRSVIPFSDNGSTELLITQNGLPPVLLKAIGVDKNNALQFVLTGTHDNRQGVGARLNLYYGAQRQTIQIGGGSGYLGQGAAEVTAGTGAFRGVDVLRILWPSGIVQDELNVLAGERRSIREADRGTRRW